MLDMSIHLILLLEYVNVARGIALCQGQAIVLATLAFCFKLKWL